MAVRTTATGRPVRRTIPVIRPSRGPGPARPDIGRGRDAVHDDAAEQKRDPPAESGRRGDPAQRPVEGGADDEALLTVPSPGRSRIGIHSSRTSAPTMIDHWPMVSPKTRTRP